MTETADSQAEQSASDKSSRREFIKSSSFIMAGGAVTGGLTVPENAHAGVNETIRVGLIGCGQRGTAATVHALNAHGSVHVVAMADAFADRIQASLRGIKGGLSGPDSPEETHGSSLVDVPQERQFVGLDAYRRLLEVDLDLVILTAPPGFRPIHFEAATAASKHVFMENPVAVDPAGVRRVLSAGQLAQANRSAVAVGLQRRHEPRYVETIQRLQNDEIGDVLFTRAYWNGSGRRIGLRSVKQTEMEYQLRHWRCFNWLSGDMIVEQHVHNLDVINWLKGAYPVSCQGQGGRHGLGGLQGGDIFDHHMVEFTYADGSKLLSQCRHMPGCWPSVSEHAHGTGGTANIANASIYDLSGQRLWKYGPGGGQGHRQQLQGLLAAIRRGELPYETEYGALSTLTAIMGRMATYSGRVIHWEEAFHADVDLLPPTYTLDAQPPVLPDDQGIYPVAVPGVTPVV